MILGFVINAMSEVYSAELIKNITDVINTDNRSELKTLPFIIIALFLFKGIGMFLGVYYSAVIARNMVYHLRTEAFQHILTLPNQYFLSHSGGKISSKLIYDVEQVTAAGTDALRTLLKEGFIVLGLLGYLLFLNWKLTLILFTLIPVIAFLIDYASKRFKAFSKNVQESMGSVSHIVGEVISGIEVVKNFGGSSAEIKRFDVASKDNLTQSLKVAATSAINVPAIQLIIAIAMAIVLFVALRPEVLGDSSAGAFIAYITACIMISKPIRELSAVNEKIQRGLAAADSLFDLIDTPKEKDLGDLNPKLTGKIQFKNASLTYGAGSEAKTAIEGFNLTIEAGQTVAFVGRSGAGKTSLTNLLTRSHELTSGDILLEDDQGQMLSITDIQMASLRNQLASVNQNVILFDATVTENIAYGELAKADFKAVEDAAKQAFAYDFINNLPNQFATKVGTDGLSLSGGQRQRIAIARALLKDAPLLILDEATSALDNESEHHIQQAIENAMLGRTTIVIAHRLSTIEQADNIVVMDKGKIIEQGSHQQLLMQNGMYASMHARNFDELDD